LTETLLLWNLIFNQGKVKKSNFQQSWVQYPFQLGYRQLVQSMISLG